MKTFKTDWLKAFEETRNDLRWCDECSKWHQEGSLTICMLRHAKRLMCEEDEPSGPFLPNPARPWGRVRDEKEDKAQLKETDEKPS